MKKKLSKKLVLNKKTISSLNEVELREFRGGTYDFCDDCTSQASTCMHDSVNYCPPTQTYEVACENYCDVPDLYLGGKKTGMPTEYGDTIQ